MRRKCHVWKSIKSEQLRSAIVGHILHTVCTLKLNFWDGILWKKLHIRGQGVEFPGINSFIEQALYTPKYFEPACSYHSFWWIDKIQDSGCFAAFKISNWPECSNILYEFDEIPFVLFIFYFIVSKYVIFDTHTHTNGPNSTRLPSEAEPNEQDEEG